VDNHGGIRYNTGAMAQRYFSVETEGSARKVALLCCGLFLAGAFLWFIPPMAMRTIYPTCTRWGRRWLTPARAPTRCQSDIACRTA